MKKIGFVDQETGEWYSSYVAVIQPKRRNGFEGGWAAMGQGAMKFIPVNYRNQLGVEGLSVFMCLLSEMDAENYIQVSQSELGRDLSMTRHNVNRAIKKLVNFKIIFEGPKVGHSRTYRLNPHVAWKGSAANHKKALKEADHLKLVHSAEPRGRG